LPAWSPDGTRLAFVNPRSGALVVYGVATGSVIELPVRADTRSAPAWAPDASRLVYLAEDGDLHSVGVAAADDVRLTPEPGLDQDPEWSGAAR
jgi:Tol biopolymer transport system component